MNRDLMMQTWAASGDVRHRLHQVEVIQPIMICQKVAISSTSTCSELAKHTTSQTKMVG